jgi:hypothetical protein
MAVMSSPNKGSVLTATQIKPTNIASVHEITLRGKSQVVSGVHVGCVFQQKAAHLRRFRRRINNIAYCSRPQKGSGLPKKQIN